MMTSKERFDLTINHRQPDQMVVDFGATPVTGIHVQTVENLRKYYGLEYKPVRVVDPYQMLGEVDEELAAILGADTVAARGRKNSFGIYNHEPLKEYLTPWGQTVLVPEGFVTTTDEKGDVVVYPEGDLSAGPSARMPESGYFDGGKLAIEQVELFLKLGADLNHVVISHVDKQTDLAFHSDLMQTGVYVEYDSHFRFMDKGDDHVYRLLENLLPDYTDRIVIGMDTAKNTYWKSYGGKPGLAYLLTEFRQELRNRGFGDYFGKLFFINPQNLYSFENI